MEYYLGDNPRRVLPTGETRRNLHQTGFVGLYAHIQRSRLDREDSGATHPPLTFRTIRPASARPHRKEGHVGFFGPDHEACGLFW